MKKKLSNLEVLDLYTGLHSPSLGSYKGVKFAYALDKSRTKLKAEYDPILKAITLSDDLLSKLTEDQKKMTNDQLIASLRESELSSEDKVEITEKIKETKAFLKEENEIELYGINFEDVPDDITGNDYKIISLFIMEK